MKINLVLKARKLFAGRLEAFLEERAIMFTTWEPEDFDWVEFSICYEKRQEAREFLSQFGGKARPDRVGKLKLHLPGSNPIPADYRISILKEKNWAEEWKKYFHTKRVSDRLVIKPSWERYRSKPGEIVIELDPGMSFGTGQHVTTRGCLRLLDRLSRSALPASFLDIGCGSGILSIAAAKLGYQAVTGIDNDPSAVRIAQENARLNHVSSECHFTVHDAARAGRKTYDVVVANMLARELEDGTEGIAKSVSRGGILILAGTLENQWKPVIKRFRPYGFREAVSLVRKGWTCGCLVRDLPGCRRQMQLVRQVRIRIVSPWRRTQAG